MTDDPKDDAGAGIAFGVSRAKRTHGLLIAGVLAAAGFAALVFAGPGLPDGEIIGVVNLALAGGVAVYVLRATRDPGVGMVLDNEGVWFGDWALPPVSWRHVEGARVAGSRLRPLLYVELRDPKIFSRASTTPRGRRGAPIRWCARPACWCPTAPSTPPSARSPRQFARRMSGPRQRPWIRRKSRENALLHKEHRARVRPHLRAGGSADSDIVDIVKSGSGTREFMPSAQHTNPKSDIEIAQAAAMRPIVEIAGDRLGIAPEHLEPYGHYKAKVSLDHIKSLADRPDGKLVLVTAITPTPAGEGKTTTTVGLGDGLNARGKCTMICLREPSLGPCFGVKGGAAGGGYAQVVPMEDINLHFTGDIHAIGTANNLLAALVDNHIYWGNALGLDPRRVTWRRAMDMNERALRQITNSLGGVANGYPREDGFDITVASEVMAIFCLARDLDDLQTRLGNIIVGYTRDREPVRASALKGHGPMAALLKDALAPNLVQTLEHLPAFIHGGPFANIAHGCNSVLATTTALKLVDYVITEAGFGADLGAEKFFDIKCRKAGLNPACVVIVATVRALKMHGGVAKENLKSENLEALGKGLANLDRHLENIARFGVPAVVAVNTFSADTQAEVDLVIAHCAALRVEAVQADHWAKGGAGALDLADAVVRTIDEKPNAFKLLYPDDMPLWDKIRTIAQSVYGADAVVADKRIRDQIDDLQQTGFGHYPVCMAKTQYSLSADPTLKGAPADFAVPIREVRVSGGAEFLVAVCGDIMTMPGLPRVPAANAISVDGEGRIVGLF